jgi:hypothetical protein
MQDLPQEFIDAKNQELGAQLAEIVTKIGMKGIVLRGAPSLCAYIGIPTWHPLAGLDYNDVPLDVHGGLTFGDRGDGEWRSAKYFWYGWDYAHSGDLCFYDLEFSGWLRIGSHQEHAWTVAEVAEELHQAMLDFRWLYFVGWLPLLVKLKIRQLAGR